MWLECRSGFNILYVTFSEVLLILMSRSLYKLLWLPTYFLIYCYHEESNVATTRLNSVQHLKISFHHFFASFYYLFYHSQISESSKCSPSYEGLPSGYSIQPCPTSLETSPSQVQALCLRPSLEVKLLYGSSSEGHVSFSW